MYNSQQVGAVIVAAGYGERMKGLDKIFTQLGSASVLEHVLSVFINSSYIDSIAIVLNEKNIEKGNALFHQGTLSKTLSVALGGKRRQDSVMAGIGSLPPCEWIIIHDGARPFLTESHIVCGLDAAQETGAAVAAVPVKDTIKTANKNYVSETLDRKTLWAIQTPQVFRSKTIIDAYSALTVDVTDDAAAVEKIGVRVKLFMGSYNNIKITTQEDLCIAKYILEGKSQCASD